MFPNGRSGEDWREWRRFRALQLKEQGWRQRHIAEALGVTEDTVGRWIARARMSGPEALLAHPAPGHPSKLSPTQRRMIPEFLWHGPEAYGFRRAVWTCAQVAKVIEEGGIRGRPSQGSCRPPAQGTALDAADTDPAGPETRRGGHRAWTARGLVGVVDAGVT